MVTGLPIVGIGVLVPVTDLYVPPVKSEIYVLDSLWRRQYVLDQFFSLIWTERWQDAGDFTLYIASTPYTRGILVEDTYLAHNKSQRVMRIESVEDDATGDGARTLIVTGTSYEGILNSRVAKESVDDLTTSPQWVITAAPADIARTLYTSICVTGVLSTSDILTGVSTDVWPTVSGIPEPPDSVTLSFDPQTLFSALVTNVCVPYDLGFRFVRNDNNATIYFNIYTGDDRTINQDALPAVIFSPALDNLQNTKELTTISDAKNVAYVFSPAGFEMVYASGVDPTAVTALNRRVLVVDGSSVTSDNPDISGALITLGQQALALAKVQQSFDGEISINSQYVYGRDYFLGDLITIVNDDGIGNDMRVTEQIFNSDNSTGESSYPTLSVSSYITSGSWLSWTEQKIWDDFESDPTTWSELP